MNHEEWKRRMSAAMPHGPDEPCTCDGYRISVEMNVENRCVCWPGRRYGCTCDIDWEKARELAQEGWTE